jgi:peptidoglycan LD-endopeptidase LytH
MAMLATKFEEWLDTIKTPLSVVPCNRGKDRLLLMNFTNTNALLSEEIVEDIHLFTHYLDTSLLSARALYGIGGYNELRTVYSRSEVFNGVEGAEPRRLHLGIDIWGAAGTEVMAPIEGVVHSLAFNKQYGDYGATIILEHVVGEESFYSLYGHLSLRDIEKNQVGDIIQQQQVFAHFGVPEENGYWPPHLHFQLILDIGNYKGDYPGVCAFSEKEKYLANCPNPDLLIDMMRYAQHAS